VNVTYKVIGTAITYGTGGPTIPVYVSASTDKGNNYTNLFSGGSISAGQTQTISGVSNGSQVVTKIKGYFKQRGWLTFSATYYSNDKTGHILSLRNGDSLPNYAAFSGQESLESFLKPYLTADNKVSIGTYDVILLAELGSIGPPVPSTADFQDAVLLVSFAQAGTCQ
jgi:hypothetical protein